jgi:hypothetical protein
MRKFGMINSQIWETPPPYGLLGVSPGAAGLASYLLSCKDGNALGVVSIAGLSRRLPWTEASLNEALTELEAQACIVIDVSRVHVYVRAQLHQRGQLDASAPKLQGIAALILDLPTYLTVLPALARDLLNVHGIRDLFAKYGCDQTRKNSEKIDRAVASLDRWARLPDTVSDTASGSAADTVLHTLSDTHSNTESETVPHTVSPTPSDTAPYTVSHTSHTLSRPEMPGGAGSTNNSSVSGDSSGAATEVSPQYQGLASSKERSDEGEGHTVSDTVLDTQGERRRFEKEIREVNQMHLGAPVGKPQSAEKHEEDESENSSSCSSSPTSVSGADTAHEQAEAGQFELGVQDSAARPGSGIGVPLAGGGAQYFFTTVEEEVLMMQIGCDIEALRRVAEYAAKLVLVRQTRAPQSGKTALKWLVEIAAEMPNYVALEDTPPQFQLLVREYRKARHAKSVPDNQIQKLLKAWVDAGGSDCGEEMVEGVKAWRESAKWLNEGGRFIPSLETYIAGAQWQQKPPIETHRIGLNSFEDTPHEDKENATIGFF